MWPESKFDESSQSPARSEREESEHRERSAAPCLQPAVPTGLPKIRRLAPLSLSVGGSVPPWLSDATVPRELPITSSESRISTRDSHSSRNTCKLLKTNDGVCSYPERPGAQNIAFRGRRAVPIHGKLAAEERVRLYGAERVG